MIKMTQDQILDNVIKQLQIYKESPIIIKNITFRNGIAGLDLHIELEPYVGNIQVPMSDQSETS